MRHLLQIVRPTNVLIIAASQWLIYYLYVIPLMQQHHIERLLTGALVPLFISVTALIAAGSYVINDIKDLQADQHNKPNKTYIGPDKLTICTAQSYYYLLTALGAGIAIYIALTIDKPWLFVIYPAAVSALYAYSASWKRRPLSGNIVVAVYCAFVPGIIWYAEADGMAALYRVAPAYILLFAAYILFGFLATLVRELVKDIEDLAGDSAAGYRTYAVVRGLAPTRRLAVGVLVLLISSYGLWLLAIWRLGSIVELSVCILAILVPSIYLLQQLMVASSPPAYTALSRQLKWLMIASLVVFCIVLW